MRIQWWISLFLISFVIYEALIYGTMPNDTNIPRKHLHFKDYAKHSLIFCFCYPVICFLVGLLFNVIIIGYILNGYESYTVSTSTYNVTSSISIAEVNDYYLFMDDTHGQYIYFIYDEAKDIYQSNSIDYKDAFIITCNTDQGYLITQTNPEEFIKYYVETFAQEKYEQQGSYQDSTVTYFMIPPNTVSSNPYQGRLINVSN